MIAFEILVCGWILGLLTKPFLKLGHIIYTFVENHRADKNRREDRSI